MFIQTFEWAWLGMTKVPSITSLQYFLQYLKKDLWDGVDIVSADKH